MTQSPTRPGTTTDAARTSRELVTDLRQRGVQLWEDKGRLRYRAPHGVFTPEHREALREHRDAVLAWLREEAPQAVPDPEGRHDPFPLTDVQTAYLLGRRESFAYGGVGSQVYTEMEFPRLEPERLEAAWNQLVRRHGMLRAVVSLDGYQRVLPEVPEYRVEVTDVRGAGSGRAEEARAATRAAMDHTVHDPERWPLFGLRLTLTDTCAVLHVSIDFLVADYLSVRTLMEELLVLYDGGTLPPLDIGFRDYLAAAGRRRDSPARDRDRSYWTNRLDDLPSAPELPLEEGAGQSPGRFRRLAAELTPGQWEAVRRAAAREHLTPSTVALAAFAEVLGRWSRTPRFCVNLTLLNREPLHPQAGRLVGDFTTVSPLEVDSAPTAPFAERARTLQSRLWEDLDHRLFSGVEVMRELARRRGPAAAMLPVVFTSTLGLGDDAQGAKSAEDGGPAGNTAPDPAREAVRNPAYGISQTPQVWIDAQAIEAGGRLQLRWDIREGVLRPGVAEAMFAQMTALLRELGEAGAAWAHTSPVPLPADQLRTRQEVNDTTGPLPDALLHDDLLAAARSHPERTAVVAADRSLTYGELLSRARAVARRLRADGCRPGEITGLVMEKGWEQVAGSLGILLAGGVYLPVDAGQPAARRARILDDAGVRRVLVQSWSAPDGDTGRATVAVDTLTPLAPDAPDTPDADTGKPSATPDDLAYVIYTSGSTGAPKGVMISHRAALNTLRDINRRFSVGAGDRVLGLAGMGFDLSVYDVFGVLGAGGTLVLPEPERRTDPSHWADLLAEHRVTLWNSVPAQLQLLEDYLAVEPRDGLDALRLALLSGDWIPVPLPDRVRRRLPGLRLAGLGGATEAAVWSVFHPIDDVDHSRPSIPYGTPLTNQRFHVLDPWMRPCPEHVTGELYIGGAGLAEGYLGDEERTAERFVAHPDTGERLYRTGDLGTYRAHGVIEFQGREDRQVKIRGHRIELAEVEAALASHPAVAAAHALTTGESPLERRLTAFAGLVPGARPVPDDGQPRRLEAAASARGDAATEDVDPAELAAFMRRLDHAGLLAMLRALHDAGLFASPGDRHTVREVLEATGAAPRHHRLLRRWLAALTDAGLLTADDGRYAARRTVTAGDLERAWQDVDELQREEWYKAGLIGYFRTCAERLPELLRDELDPLPLLFPEGGLDLSYAAYRDNVLSRYVNHAVTGFLLELTAGSRVPPRVLEIGAGVGGTSTVLVPELSGTGARYVFTDVSPFFLNEARERFGETIGYGLLDINEDFRQQGWTPNSHDVVICANVLHNARHAGTVLERLRELLAPGGWLVFIETTRENVQIMTSMEFMMPDKDPAKWDYEDLRRGRDQTFLEAGQWRELLTGAGADTVVDLPRDGDVTEPFGQRVFAARFKADRLPVRDTDVLEHAAGRVPEYMLPARLELLDELPLTGNGKTDTAVLREWAERPAAKDTSSGAGGGRLDPLEERIAAVWADLLKIGHIGREDDFYRLGGDSLLVARLAGRIREEVPEAAGLLYDTVLRALLNRPTVGALAAFLREAGDARAADGDEAGPDVSPLIPLAGTLAAPPPDGEDAGAAEPLRVLVHDGVGTLAAYRSLVPLLRGPGPLAGLAVPLTDPYAHEDPGDLVVRRAADYTARLLDTGRTAFHVVGYCMGGLLATEVARQLTESGARVESLAIVSSYGLPHSIEDELVLEYVFARLLHADTEALGYPGDAATARAFDAVLAATPGRVPEGALDSLGGDCALQAAAERFAALRAVPHEHRLAAIGAAAADGAAPPAADHTPDGGPGAAPQGFPGDLSALYGMYRTSMAAVTRHRAEPYAGDIVFLREREATGFLPWLREDMTAFWRDLCLGGLDVVDVPGDHFSCLGPRNAEHVARVLDRLHTGGAR